MQTISIQLFPCSISKLVNNLKKASARPQSPHSPQSSYLLIFLLFFGFFFWGWFFVVFFFGVVVFFVFFFCFVPLVGKSDHIYQEFSILIWTIEMQTIFDQFAKQQMSER